jgi:hypothetical protein
MRFKIQGIQNYFQDKEYGPYKFHSIFEMEHYAAYEFRLIGNTENTKERYFLFQINYQAIEKMNVEENIKFIENLIQNQPDIKKASHHQEFYNKFDEMLK